MHFNCSNVNAVTLYTMAVPINSTDPEYSPLLWQFLYVSSPSTTPCCPPVPRPASHTPTTLHERDV